MRFFCLFLKIEKNYPMCFSPALGGKKSCQVEVSKNKSRCSYFVNQRFEKISSLYRASLVCVKLNFLVQVHWTNKHKLLFFQPLLPKCMQLCFRLFVSSYTDYTHHFGLLFG